MGSIYFEAFVFMGNVEGFIVGVEEHGEIISYEL